MIFDTLTYANRLKAAGLEPKIAEAQAAANAELFSSLIEDRLVTKDDLREALSNALKDMATKSDLQKFITKDEAKSFVTKDEARSFATKDDIEALRKELFELEARIDMKMELRFKELENRLLLRLGGMMMAGLAVIGVFIRFLH